MLATEFTEYTEYTEKRYAAILRSALAAKRAHWRLHTVHPLSPRTARLELSHSGQPFSAILQRHSLPDRQLNPRIAQDEYRLLGLLHAAGLPVPHPLLLLRQMEPPGLITEFVLGERLQTCAAPVDLPESLAGLLHRVHHSGIAPSALDFLPRLRDRLPRHLQEAKRDESGIRATLLEALPGIRFNPPTLLHGDFWLGNLLWRGAELAAIIDWEDSILGDPLADLGKSRLELLWALGEAAVERYTECYLRLNPTLNTLSLPFWDLYGAWRLSHFANFADAAASVQGMRARYQAFIRAAMARLEAAQE